MVIVIMGVSGSGKTTVGQALARRLGWAFVDADDHHPPANLEKMRRGMPLTDEDREPWLRVLGRLVQDHVAGERDLVLACSALRTRHREALRRGISDHAMRFVYLRGDYDRIDRRLRDRTGHFMPESLLRSQFEALEEPGPEEAVAVDVGPPVPAMVDAIARGLHLAV